MSFDIHVQHIAFFNRHRASLLKLLRISHPSRRPRRTDAVGSITTCRLGHPLFASAAGRLPVKSKQKAATGDRIRLGFYLITYNYDDNTITKNRNNFFRVSRVTRRSRGEDSEQPPATVHIFRDLRS